MRQVNSAFYAACQEDEIKMCELITLSTRAGNLYWTTSNFDIVSSGQVYSPFPGQSGSGIEESTDLGVSHVDFSIVNTGSFLKDIVAARQIDMADITIRRVFTYTPDMGAITIFQGKIGDYSHDRNKIVGDVRGQQSSRAQQWPYYTYQDGCGWKFGGPGCGFPVSSITIVSTINVALSNRAVLTLTSGALVNFPPTSLEFGKVTVVTGANSGQQRTIFSNSGDVIILSHTLPFSLELFDRISFFRGCRKRLLEDCTSFFNNNSAFLGFQWIPRQEDAF